MNYFAVAYYYFTDIQDPQKEVQEQKKFFNTLDMKGRIYISEEGLNGQTSVAEKDFETFSSWLKERFPNILFKLHDESEQVFAKMTVKYRKRLVAMDEQVNLQNTGEHVSPKKWKEMLEKRDENTLLIDVRNDYESKIGHFEGAELPPCNTFRDFKQYTQDLQKRTSPEKTKIMMYCTGGIRCEYYSSYLKEKGYQHLYQLDGGVIQYGLTMGAKHWRGKLFVFDDRLVIPISEDNQEVISHCDRCQAPCDTYINCANMDCNDLFLCCVECMKKLQGCCSQECLQKGRVRKANLSEKLKPFRKCPHEEKIALRNRNNSSISCCV